MMALGPIILGYNYGRTNRAVKRQLKKGMIYSLASPLEVELAELIREVVPCAEMVRFGKNGSDVTSIAVRIARHYSGKELLLSPEGHYHGWTDFYAAVSPRNYGLPKCMHELVHRFKYNDLADLEKYLATGQYAAVIMEPVALEPPVKGYLKGVRALCDKYNTILILDEMITGFRWALGGAQEYYGITADIATYGKAVSNGMPLAVLCGKTKYMQELDKVFFSGTYLGDALSIAAAIETIKELKENHHEVYTHIWEQGERMAAAFNTYAREIGVDAEMFGTGPRHNIKFNVADASGAKDLFHQEMIARNIFMGTQIYICWSHTPAHIDKTIRAMKQSLNVVKRALVENKIDTMLRGDRSAAIFKQATAAKTDPNAGRITKY
jgi:glutamate-1-semialdehyde 2,1-aminomutase